MPKLFNSLSNNFLFLEKDKLNIESKDEIINLIIDSEKMNNLSYSIINLSKVLELIVNDIIIKEKIDSVTKNDRLVDKIKAMEVIASKRADGKYLFCLMHEIRNARNHESHKQNDSIKINFNKTDVISKLKNIHVILNYLYDLDLDEFDDEIYQVGNKTTEQLSAISTNERLRDQKEYVIKDESLDIKKDSIRSWMSISNSRLLVPIYQRKYEWNEENIKTLLEDITNRKIDGFEHYFGTVAIKKQLGGHEINSPNIIKIIDGQQRLTTSLLIICAARDILLDLGQDINEIDWYQGIIKKHNRSKLSEYIYNPGGTSEDNEMFRKILDMEITQNEKSSSKYLKNYLVARKYIEKETNKEMVEIYDYINTFLRIL